MPTINQLSSLDQISADDQFPVYSAANQDARKASAELLTEYMAESLSGLISASDVTNTPSGGIAATDVQSALTELDTEKASLAQLASGGGATLVGYTPPSGPVTTVQARLVEYETSQAALIGYTPSGTGAVATTVQAKLRESVSIADYATLADAINALPAEGGVIEIPVGRYPAGSWTYNTAYMSKANVTLRGKKMPGLSANADRLEGGSVIYGRFNVFADNFAVENLGFDLGKYVMDTEYPGYDSLSANHPLGGTWDAFAFAQPNMGFPLPARKNFRAQNLIGLLSRPLSLGHAVLMEGFDGGFVDNVIGVYGVHACVIKATNVRGGSIAGWMGSTENVIFKSDTYAPAGHINIASIESLTSAPNCMPWISPTPAAHGLMLNPATASFTGPISIGALKCFGSTRGLSITGGASFNANDIQIATAMMDGYTGSMTTGIDFYTCRALRASIGSLVVNSALQGVSWAPATVSDNGQHQLSIGSCQLTNITVRGIAAVLYGRIRIDSLEMATVLSAYYIDNNARVMVGKETLMDVTTKWERSPPALGTGWSSFGSGNSTWDVALKDYGVEIKGLLLAGGTATGTVASLPIYLRPTEDKRLPGYLNNGSRNYALIGVTSAGSVVLNDGTAPAAGNYISVDGCAWQHW